MDVELEKETPRPTSYRDRFGLAAALVQEQKYARAGQQAKLNLTNLWLPRFWQIKNCIIIICTETDWEEAQAYIDITEELWEVARCELPDEIATWPPSLRSDFELLKEDQESQREKCHRPAQTEPHEYVACLGDEGIFGFENDDAASTDEEEDEDYEVEEAWDSEDERRDRSTEADALEAIRMTLRRPEGHVVRAKVIVEDSQLQRSATSEVRQEEEKEPQKELRDSPERQEEQKPEHEATPTWFARLSMATQSIRYMY